MKKYKGVVAKIGMNAKIKRDVLCNGKPYKLRGHLGQINGIYPKSILGFSKKYKYTLSGGGFEKFPGFQIFNRDEFDIVDLA